MESSKATPSTTADQSGGVSDRIEILSTDLLDRHRPTVEEFRALARRLRIGLGWHYLLDLSWTAAAIGSSGSDDRVLDAGAGTGVIQWWLAGRGIDVISVDRRSRSNLATRFRQQYPVQGWRTEDLGPAPSRDMREVMPSVSPRRWHDYPQKLAAALREWTGRNSMVAGSGSVFIYNQGLESMQDIVDDSVDDIVSISSLEHNSPAGLRTVVAELIRILKPGGRIIATLGAAKDEDWLHEPSHGWCYTEATLREIFDLPDECQSNYDSYDELFELLRDCRELRGNLADFYYQSGKNGMPRGVWDPQYQPVGVIKSKEGAFRERHGDDMILTGVHTMRSHLGCDEPAFGPVDLSLR